MRGAPQPAARGAAGEGARTQSGARNVWRARRARIESRAASPGARVAPPHQTPRAPLARAFRPGHRRARKKARGAKIARAKLIAGGRPRETFIQ